MLKIVFLIAILLICATPEESLAGDDFYSIFSRGISIHDAMNWASTTPDKSRYQQAPFSDTAHPYSVGELETIRKGGFNFVRLTVDVGPFLNMTGPDRDALDALLLDHVKMALSADLAIIVDFHPVTQLRDYSPTVLVADPDAQIFQQYCDMLTRTADLLAKLHSPRIALELMNEPQIGWSASGYAKWQRMQERLYDAARRGSPTLKLILTGGDGGSAKALTHVNPAHFAADSAAIFTFHYYLPYDFTMQSLSDDATRKLEQDVPYPADARPIEDSMSALKKRQDDLQMSPADKEAEQVKALPLLLTYHKSGFSRQTIAETFESLQRWARANQLPSERIFLGEFGVTRRYGRYHGARDEERLAWLSDVHDIAEANHFPWGIWAYRGYGGMALIIDDNTEQLDSNTLNALKLVH